MTVDDELLEGRRLALFLETGELRPRYNHPERMRLEPYTLRGGAPGDSHPVAGAPFAFLEDESSE